MATPRIGVIVGTVREGRFSEKAAEWLTGQLAGRTDLEFETVDLRDYPLPLFAEPMAPSMKPSDNEVSLRFQKKIGELDGFIFVTGEYNNSVPGVLKNATDYVYAEWNRKPAAFFGYGGAGGTRAVQHLKQIAVELQMAPVRQGAYVFGGDFFPIMMGQKSLDDVYGLADSVKDMADNLSWFARALKTAREA